VHLPARLPFADVDRRFGETRAAFAPGAGSMDAPQSLKAAPMNSPRTLTSIFAALILIGAGSARAQHGGDGASPASAPAEAKQFDFLIGQWELEVKPKVNGLAAMIHGAPKLVGTWKAWRGFDGFGVEDELRISDASGNPMSLNHALRAYDRTQSRWNIVGLDVYRSRISNSTAHWQGGEMHIEGNGVDGEGKPYASRTRYFDITPDHFRMQQDRSSDNGQTWDEAALVIDAKRVAAAAAR
jgi:hypothetical protein